MSLNYMSSLCCTFHLILFYLKFKPIAPLSSHSLYFVYFFINSYFFIVIFIHLHTCKRYKNHAACIQIENRKCNEKVQNPVWSVHSRVHLNRLGKEKHLKECESEKRKKHKRKTAVTQSAVNSTIIPLAISISSGLLYGKHLNYSLV